jgi:acetyl esterase/lipase
MIPFKSIYFDEEPREGRILDIFEAADSAREIAFFFVHGGGWEGGSRSIFHQIIHEYVKSGFDCASTDYRLKDVTIFDQVADIRVGLDIFAADLAKRNRPQKVLLIGSSAGAHLALLTAFAKPEECGMPDRPLTFACDIAGIAVQSAPFTFKPWQDIFPGIWQSMQSAVGAPYCDHEELYRQVSPVHYIRTGMPPLFALHAENEEMFPHEIYTRFAERSLQYGNVVQEKMYPRTEHGFFYSLERWQQREAFEDIREFAESVAIHT